MYKSSYCIREESKDCFGQIVYLWSIEDSIIGTIKIKAPSVHHYRAEYMNSISGIVAIWNAYKQNNPSLEVGRYLAMRVRIGSKFELKENASIRKEILQCAKSISENYINWKKYEQCITRSFELSLWSK